MVIVAVACGGASEEEQAFDAGVEWAEQELWADAIASYDEAIRLDPEYVDAYYNRGLAYSKIAETSKAIDDLTEAIRLDPEHGPAYGKRGALRANLGQIREAFEDLDEAIRLDPELVVLDARDSRVPCGECHEAEYEAWVGTAHYEKGCQAF